MNSVCLYQDMMVEFVAVYCRVSSEEQKEKHSIEAQISSAKGYIKAQDDALEITDWYLDDGVTGTLPLKERNAGGRLLSDARQRKFKRVIVWKIDRLGRKVSVILNAIAELEALGVTISSMTEPFDTSHSAGRLMVNMLASFADFEHDVIIERSVEGTNYRAKLGQWLGGIVPYGYEVVGKKREARLMVSNKTLPNLNMVEADVIRLIYERLAEDRQSCIQIARELNALGVPPAYTKDKRLIAKDGPGGKRRVNTAGIWRPSRIRNLVVNPVYKGIHVYGRRSKKKRDLIERRVPGIVSEEIWERAQQTLKENMVFSPHNAKHKYLLRGLITCDHCGLHYVGCCYHGHNGQPKRYYRCGGKTAFRGPYEGKCPGKAISADLLEQAIWHKIELMLLTPNEVLERLSQQQLTEQKEWSVMEATQLALGKAVQDKKEEKEKVLDLYRRNFITLNDLESQLVKIANEESFLKIKLGEFNRRAEERTSLKEKLDNAETVLERLQEILTAGISWEVKRRVIELLVWDIKVGTTTVDNVRQNDITVTFAFDTLQTNYTDKDSWLPPA